ncbi:MAG: DUF5060 domain-containing protein [Bacteroidales bacterium]|nr:DUF5060 domain-containing protein [Bacteroidales bacterium]
MKTQSFILLLCLFLSINYAEAQTYTEVGLYRTFERSVTNTNPYSNKFSDVELNCKYISPTGDTTDFYGFFDGDGNGGGNLTTGNIWKLRFMPDTVGQWIYSWSWSDTTTGGQDTFLCVTENAGKGILRAYENNPRWLAYNGTEPVWIKSYYESGHGAIAQDFDWIKQNVYQPLIDEGYNHLMVNWLLSLCCYNQFYHDGPAQSTTDLTLYTSGQASSTMRLDVWKLMEQNVAWLNEHNIGLFMFLGLNGGRNGGPDWTILSEAEKDFYIRYVVARLAPYANIAGWNYTWEVEGNTENGELGCMRLIQKYDVFDHLRGYQDEKPKYNEFHRPEYNFAGVENHRIHSDNREPQYWAEPWTHHWACLMGYVPGKPVYMVEGNALWRRYWRSKIFTETGKYVTLDQVRQSAWGCATAASSFTWCGHNETGDLMAYGEQGLPFHGDVNPYARAAYEIDLLADVMNNEVAFYNLSPSDSLLSGCDSLRVWCLSDSAEQYLVFTTEGDSFKLQLAVGQYNSNQWINTKTGAGVETDSITISVVQNYAFVPPDTINDWVLLVRKEWEKNIKEDANIISAETDTSGLKLFVTCNKDMNDPTDFHYGFKVKVNGKTTGYTIDSISYNTANKPVLILEVSKQVVIGDVVLLSYSGTLRASDSSVLSPVTDMNVVNNSVVEPTGVYFKKINDMEFTLFPNPCSDNLTVSSNVKMSSINVFDITGKSLFEIDNIDELTKPISMINLPKGVYVLSITSAYATTVHKILKE